MKTVIMIKTTTPEIGTQLEKALKSAGYIPAQPEFHWVNDILFFVESEWPKDERSHFVAYTMGELWEMLPNSINEVALTDDATYYVHSLNLRKIGRLNECWYDSKFNKTGYTNDDNPCNALAKLVIWCIENNHPLNLEKK